MSVVFRRAREPGQGAIDAHSSMSAFGYKQTFRGLVTMSAFRGKADIPDGIADFRF